MLRSLLVISLLLAGLTLERQSYASDSATYTYDANGRIHTITYANGTVVTYTYDAAGNRSTVVTSCAGGGC